MGLSFHWNRFLGSVYRIALPDSDRGKQAEWHHLMGKVREAVAHHRFGEIEPALRQAEKWLDSTELKSVEKALRLNELGEAFHELAGDNERSQRLFLQALECMEGKHEDDSFAYGMTLNNLGLLLAQQRRYEEAETYFRKLLPLAEDHFGTQHEEVASCLENLSAALRNRPTGASAEAADLRVRAQKIRKAARLEKLKGQRS